jgi:hypothetical protein
MGDSEHRIAELFACARAAHAAVLFIDEIGMCVVCNVSMVYRLMPTHTYTYLHHTYSYLHHTALSTASGLFVHTYTIPTHIYTFLHQMSCAASAPLPLERWRDELWQH